MMNENTPHLTLFNNIKDMSEIIELTRSFLQKDCNDKQNCWLGAVLKFLLFKNVTNIENDHLLEDLNKFEEKIIQDYYQLFERYKISLNEDTTIFDKLFFRFTNSIKGKGATNEVNRNVCIPLERLLISIIKLFNTFLSNYQTKGFMLFSYNVYLELQSTMNIISLLLKMSKGRFLLDTNNHVKIDQKQQNASYVSQQTNYETILHSTHIELLDCGDFFCKVCSCLMKDMMNVMLHIDTIEHEILCQKMGKSTENLSSQLYTKEIIKHQSSSDECIIQDKGNDISQPSKPLTVLQKDDSSKIANEVDSENIPEVTVKLYSNSELYTKEMKKHNSASDECIIQNNKGNDVFQISKPPAFLQDYDNSKITNKADSVNLPEVTVKLYTNSELYTKEIIKHQSSSDESIIQDKGNDISQPSKPLTVLQKDDSSKIANEVDSENIPEVTVKLYSNSELYTKEMKKHNSSSDECIIQDKGNDVLQPSKPSAVLHEDDNYKITGKADSSENVSKCVPNISEIEDTELKLVRENNLYSSIRTDGNYFFCFLCHKQITSVQHILQHIKNPQHAKLVHKNNENTSLHWPGISDEKFMNVFNRNVMTESYTKCLFQCEQKYIKILQNGQLFCDPCHQFIHIIDMESHLSIKHQIIQRRNYNHTEMEDAFINDKNISFTPLNGNISWYEYIKTDGKYYYCFLCNCFIHGVHNAEEHAKGIKHISLCIVKGINIPDDFKLISLKQALEFNYITTQDLSLIIDTHAAVHFKVLNGGNIYCLICDKSVNITYIKNHVKEIQHCCNLTKDYYNWYKHIKTDGTHYYCFLCYCSLGNVNNAEEHAKGKFHISNCVISKIDIPQNIKSISLEHQLISNYITINELKLMVGNDIKYFHISSDGGIYCSSCDEYVNIVNVERHVEVHIV